MKAEETRAHIDPAVWRNYSSLPSNAPWDRQVSHRYREESDRPDFATFIHKDKKAHINNFGVYSIDGNLAVDFLGRFETLEKDLRFALEHVGLSTAGRFPMRRRGSVPAASPVEIITKRRPGTSWPIGMRRRSSSSATSSDAERLRPSRSCRGYWEMFRCIARRPVWVA